MAIQIGQQLGSLEITALLGKGGMGEVYRARDTKLKRDVAIKILPDEFARDADRVNRFQREAEVLASLSHPNIAGIYDLQQTGETRFLVMELVDGETLADRIKRGPLPVEEALQIGKSICEALEAAHEKGIVHRDLKPANIKITPDGKVKVLDFGLAKAMESSPATTMSNSPTLLSVAASGAGVILGTAAYMSPEQASGTSVDKRSDLWAFGVVLMEMLTARPVFKGETVSHVLAAVLKDEPDWTALPSNTPAPIRKLLRRCLEKDRKRRLESAADARLEIADGLMTPPESAALPLAVPRARERLAWIVAAGFLIVIATLSVPTLRYFHEVAPAEVRVEVNTPPTTDPSSFAISPDGRRLVFVASNAGNSQLWLRPLDSLAAQPLAGTEGAFYPFWSPDSASVAFFAGTKLERIDIVGGAPRVLGDAILGRGGSWNRKGIILFAPSASAGLYKVPASGGEATMVTRLERGQTSHRFPQFLPDGEHFIYFEPASRYTYAGSLNGSLSKRLVAADAAAAVSPSGFLLFPRQATMFAQPFDFNRLELSGDPIPVADQVALFDPTIFGSGFSITSDAVAYRTGSNNLTRQLTWLDRSGKPMATLGAPDSADLSDVEVSPDGRHIAVQRTVNHNADIWLIDSIRGVSTRFTFDPAFDNLPVWSPDGRQVVFQSNRPSNVFNLYVKASSGAGAEELLLQTDQTKAAHDWSPDGRFLLYRTTDPKTSFDLWVLPMFGDKKPFPFLRTPADERDGQFSPDGKWIAYQSNESGRFEIYVQPFPGPGGKFQISSNGGAQVRWNKNGKEIFYLSLDSKMMAAAVKLSSDGQSLETGNPTVLFPVRIAGGPLPSFHKQQYAISSDGQRFLANVDTGETKTSPITLILNWHPPKP